jgi:hypothetical protein
MKLGSQTGSVINHLYSRMVIGQSEIQVGMGATLLSWTDRHAGTITEVLKEGKYIVVRCDIAKRTDENGMSECQKYEYTTNPEGDSYTFTQKKDGRWIHVYLNPSTGRYNQSGSYGLRIGARETYYDYSF